MTKKTKYDIKDFVNISAVELLERLKVRNLPISPKRIANKLGIEVSYEWKGEHIDKSGFATLKNGKPYIWVNPTHSTKRQKFTLAHEICHILNDILPVSGGTFDDYEIDFFARDRSPNLQEYIANDFAGKLLMPYYHIRKELLRLQAEEYPEGMHPLDAIRELVDIFKVSEDAMRVRLMRLKIIK